MGRRPCCSKEGLNRGAWTSHEDRLLIDYINTHGEGKWRDLPQRAGLKRCGKSCRLRWLNYLRPDIKRGNISHEEEDLIIRLHGLLGNRWSLIAGRLPGRTDNEIKNYWNTNLSKKIRRQDHPPKKNSSIQTRLTMQDKTETHQAIRTKAVRCTRVVLPKEEQCPMMKLGNLNVAHQDEDPLSFLNDLDMADFINSEAFINDNGDLLQQDCGCGGPDHDHQAHDGNMYNGDNCGDCIVSSSLELDRLFALDEEMFQRWGATDAGDL